MQIKVSTAYHMRFKDSKDRKQFIVVLSDDGREVAKDIAYAYFRQLYGQDLMMYHDTISEHDCITATSDAQPETVA